MAQQHMSMHHSIFGGLHAGFRSVLTIALAFEQQVVVRLKVEVAFGHFL